MDLNGVFLFQLLFNNVILLYHKLHQNPTLQQFFKASKLFFKMDLAGSFLLWKCNKHAIWLAFEVSSGHGVLHQKQKKKVWQNTGLWLLISDFILCRVILFLKGLWNCIQPSQYVCMFKAGLTWWHQDHWQPLHYRPPPNLAPMNFKLLESF